VTVSAVLNIHLQKGINDGIYERAGIKG
jgi:hypothetical protein